jgi:hypothetical protein
LRAKEYARASIKPLNNHIDAEPTWEGARKEQMRRWANMPLEEIILALEEMQAIAEQLTGSVKKPHAD